MLFHSTKKPVELSIIHLNKIKDKRQEQVSATVQNGQQDKKCTLLNKLCKKAKDKAENRAKNNTNKSDDATKTNKSVFVLDFDGDMRASAVADLREEISVIISSAKAGDEVVLRLESGGGQVHSYGLAAAQLERIRQAGLTLTVCVDKIAASGGYMMACVADKIIAQSFAVVGSIGVVSQIPNFHEWLKKHDIDVEMFTAGQYKRTVTMLGENDDEDRAKYQEDINRIHTLFKEHVKSHRPSLDMEKVATGEFWFGEDALILGLIDEIGTSDAYLLNLMHHHEVFVLHTRTKPTLAQKLGLSEQAGVKVGEMLGRVMSSAGEELIKYRRP